ncbi:condensation domain-containing protein, partial [Peribacillus simplex]|uniref:condensation domain-containing protein n=1 Tax=Peribacillus simplex TaxID=1478 RepID=UPI003D2CC9AC
MKQSDISKIYPLSPMQEGMLFHNLLDRDSNAYTDQLTFYLEGQLDSNALEKAFNILIEKYDVFRTCFIHEKLAKPRQVVLKERKLNLSLYDITKYEEDKMKLRIKEIQSTEIKKGFNLLKDHLLRVLVIKYDENKFAIVWTNHHIIIDGWCNSLIINELFEVYSKLIRNETVKVEKVVQFGSYIDWLNKQDKVKSRDFWSEYLNNFNKLTTISDRKKKQIDQFETSEYLFEINEKNTKKLNEIAHKNHVTFNTVLQTLWGIMLQKMNFTKDVIFGKVVSGRPAEIKGIEEMIGLFINTVPVRMNFKNKKAPFVELLKIVQTDSIEIEQFEYDSLADMTREVGFVGEELFDHIISFQNFNNQKQVDSESTDTEGLQIKRIDSFEQTNFGFTVQIQPATSTIFKFSYNNNYVSAERVDLIKRSLLNIVGQVVQNPLIKLEELSLIDHEGSLNLKDFHEYNSRQSECIISSLQEIVRQIPENLALVFQDKSFSYDQLNRRANRLAYRLKTEGIGKEDVVGILSGPHPDMIVGILAVLKAGAGYLPIDPNYPVERINFMLADSRASVLLIHPACQERCAFDGRVLDLTDAYEGYSEENLPLPEGEDLAYVIYTSGSTGTPKGVMVEHRSLVNLATWH